MRWRVPQLTARRPAAGAVSPAALPTAPTDVERECYVRRTLTGIVVLSCVGFLGVVVSATRFALTHDGMQWYLAVVGASCVYFAISLRVNAFTRDFDFSEHRARVERWHPGHLPSVDVFLPICGEDLRVLQNTWEHVAQLRWAARLRVYVLDDGDDPAARGMAERFGFRYLARPDRGLFKKAGNLRYGFERSDGELIAIFDADFAPRPDFLRELVPYFDDARVGIVQSPQYFRVLTSQGWLERGAGAVQEWFYRVVQTSRQQREGAICVGSNAVYRRAALESNGGTTLIEHSEDVHTGFDLRRRGWSLRYVPVVLATGLCPGELGAFVSQQYRWCMGSMSLLGSRKFWATRMAVRTRLCYLSGFGYYVFTAVSTILMPLVPLVLLARFPQSVQLGNYVLLIPSMVLLYIVLPRWHHCRFGLEAWSTKLIYGWAHLFALVDLARRRPEGWKPTGGRATRGGRARRYTWAIGVWSGGTAVAWCVLAIERGLTRPVDFAPMLLFGAFYAVTVARVFTPTRPARAPRSSRRWVLRVVLVMAATIPVLIPAVSAARPLPQGRFLGVVSDAASFKSWQRAVGPIRVRMTFQAWKNGADPAALLAHDRRMRSMPMVSWEPWKPPPFGDTNQGRAQPAFANAAIVRGRWDGLLRRWARAARAFRSPVLIRWAHEMNGAWYPWSIDPIAFRAAWRHVVTVFRQNGARNAVWIWSPNPNFGQPMARWSPGVQQYWPGARYVDALGMTDIAFASLDDSDAFDRARHLYDTFHKPVVLSEVNVNYGRRTAWLQALAEQLRQAPWVRGIVWSQPRSRGSVLHPEFGNMQWDARRDRDARAALRRIARDLAAS